MQAESRKKRDKCQARQGSRSLSPQHAIVPFGACHTGVCVAGAHVHVQRVYVCVRAVCRVTSCCRVASRCLLCHVVLPAMSCRTAHCVVPCCPLCRVALPATSCHAARC